MSVRAVVLVHRGAAGVGLADGAGGGGRVQLEEAGGKSTAAIFAGAVVSVGGAGQRSLSLAQIFAQQRQQSVAQRQRTAIGVVWRLQLADCQEQRHMLAL